MARKHIEFEEPLPAIGHNGGPPLEATAPAKSKRVAQRYYAFNELAAYLGISRRALYSLIEAGVFSPPRRIGTIRRFDMRLVQPQLDAMFAGAGPGIDEPTPSGPNDPPRRPLRRSRRLK